MATEILPVPAQDAELARLKTEASRVLAGAQEIAVKDADSEAYATAYLAEIGKTLRETEARRVALKEPYLEGGRSIDTFVNTFIGPVKQANELLRGRVIAYQQAQKRKAEEEQRRQEAERRKATEEAERLEREARENLEQAARLETQDKAAGQAALDAALKAEQEAIARRTEAAKPVVVLAPATTVRTGMGTSTLREDWTFEVVNLGLVPASYFTLNDQEVRKAIRNGAREIPGLRIYDKGGLTVRG